MSWLKKLMPSRIRTDGTNKKRVPEGTWQQCKECSAALYARELEKDQMVCPKCAHHMPMVARERLLKLFDPDSTEEIAAHLEPLDALKFRDKKTYKSRISQAQKATGERDALVAMSGTLRGRPLVASAFDFRFMGGSMGSVVGERFSRAAQKALSLRCPMVNFSATGGARMQESLLSLMQMAKTSAVLGKMASEGLPYVSVLTHPTTGGVSASLGMLGDINIAEPGALIGFAGPRVIEQTVRETLPEGFQRSEFLLEHGAVDMIVDRRHMRDTLYQLFNILLPFSDPNTDSAEVEDRSPENTADAVEETA